MVDIPVVTVSGAAQTVKEVLMNRVADISIAVCAAIFIAILGISAYWDRSIVALHFAEAGLYLVVAVLCLRQRKYGYALGVASGAFCGWQVRERLSFETGSSASRCFSVPATSIGGISSSRRPRPLPPPVSSPSRCGGTSVLGEKHQLM